MLMTDERVGPHVLEALARYGSATAQNAGVVVRGFVHESADYSGPSLQCFIPGQDQAVVGFAFTGRMTPLRETDRALDWNAYYDALAQREGPTIIVLEDIDELPGRAVCMGDVMAHRYRALGASGAIVGGSVRDVAGIRKVNGFGLWATGRTPGHGPFHVVDMDCDVSVAGLAISSNDLLVADADGVTRVPLDDAEAIAKACVAVHEIEESYHRVFSKPGFTIEDHEAFKRSLAEEAKTKPYEPDNQAVLALRLGTPLQ